MRAAHEKDTVRAGSRSVLRKTGATLVGVFLPRPGRLATGKTIRA